MVRCHSRQPKVVVVIIATFTLFCTTFCFMFVDVEAFVVPMSFGIAQTTRAYQRVSSSVCGSTFGDKGNVRDHTSSYRDRRHPQARKTAFNLFSVEGEVGEEISVENGTKSDWEMVNGASMIITKADVEGRQSVSKTQRSATAGLSKFHQSLLSPTVGRQRFVTGQFPLRVTIQENPTRKWLGQLGSRRESATSLILVNGTSIERSLASYDRFQWLDDAERETLHDRYAMVSLELIAEINVKKPGYVNLLSAHGAGSTASARRAAEANKGWNRWKMNSVLLEELEEEAWQETEQQRLWITGFSLTKQSGEMHYVDVNSGFMGTVNSRTARAIPWPNEVSPVPIVRNDGRALREEGEWTDSWTDGIRSGGGTMDDALLVSDGFLVPGKDKGGLYIVRNPGNDETEWRISLTGDNIESDDTGWFYHRAVWIDLTGDGRQSILTARAKPPSILSSGTSTQQDAARPTQGQLLWLERPKPHRYDEATGTPIESDGTVFDPFSARHMPWKTRVLDEGPDVMFSVADLDPTDETVEVIASQFFSKSLSLHSIERGPHPRVTFRRILDDRCGPSFSSVLADLDGRQSQPVAETCRVVDSGSTVQTLKPDDAFSHVLLTSHECTFAEKDGGGVNGASRPDAPEVATSVDDVESNARMGLSNDPSTPTAAAASASSTATSGIDGGSLFAYRVPLGKGAWKTEPWARSVIATGFRVRGQLNNMINPGAPGFCYTFYPTQDGASRSSSWSRPLIGIAGDCAEAAYILRPVDDDLNGESTRTSSGGGENRQDRSTNYALMCEIECGATVGSLGIGYDDFCRGLNDECLADQQTGYAKLYVPCYEKDKILVFAMGSGEEDCAYQECDFDDGW